MTSCNNVDATALALLTFDPSEGLVGTRRPGWDAWRSDDPTLGLDIRAVGVPVVVL